MRQKKQDCQIQYLFKNVKFSVDVDEDIYDDNDKKEISRIVNGVSKEICIDKSYVDFDENKHNDTFIELDGWNKLCKLVKKTKFGKNATPSQDEELDEAFKLLAYAYVYSILEKYGYDISCIQLSFKDNSSFRAIFLEDTVDEWKYYPGKWQDWKLK